MDDDCLTTSPPIYLAGMKTGYWRRGERMPAAAFVAPSAEGADDQVVVLSDVVALPKDVLGYVQKRLTTYQLSYKKSSGQMPCECLPQAQNVVRQLLPAFRTRGIFFPTCADFEHGRHTRTILWASVALAFSRAFGATASQNSSLSLGDELLFRSRRCRCANLLMQSTNQPRRGAKSLIRDS